MSRLLYLSCFFACGFFYAQQTSPMEILFQEEPPLRIQVRDVPQARKAFKRYQLKIISGTMVASTGIIVLNHSLGSISPHAPHQWAVTGIGASLVGAGLLITKGAKKKRQEAKEILMKEKQIALEWHPTALKITF